MTGQRGKGRCGPIRSRFVLASLTVALVLTGCGGGDDGIGQTTAAHPTPLSTELSTSTVSVGCI